MQLVNLAKVLSDETRMRVVMLLMGQGELCVCDLTQVMKMAQPKISRHLAILRECGLLTSRKSGQWVHYSLHPELPEWAKTVLDSMYSGGQQEALYQQDVQRIGVVGKTEKPCC